mmetsp:Transcript_17402/g.32998  ORF Transcript_17402/g.32998 Transcript_17402/m.32998 type:complete len:177 (+) Transcript_17402:170-700(+)
MGQCLDFHTKMSKTLINPNQLRAFSVPVCDDPTDMNRALGIQLDENTFLPMSMSGTICGMMTWCPTDDELNSCRIFTISNKHEWDPATVTFDNVGHSSTRYSQVCALSLYRSSLTCAYSHAWHDDSPDDMIPSFERLQVSSTMLTSRHHGVSPENLAEKWECSIIVAKATLQATTQ